MQGSKSSAMSIQCWREEPENMLAAARMRDSSTLHVTIGFLRVHAAIAAISPSSDILEVLVLCLRMICGRNVPFFKVVKCAALFGFIMTASEPHGLLLHTIFKGCLCTRHKHQCKGNPSNRRPDEPIVFCIELVQALRDQDEIHKESEDIENILQKCISQGHTGIASHPSGQCLCGSEERGPNGPHDLDCRIIGFGKSLTHESQ